MEINDTQHYIEFGSSDEYGKFTIRIVKTYPMQLQVETENGDSSVFLNIDKKELFSIRNMIDKVLSPVPESGPHNRLGIATTVGELKKLIADYPDDISFGFQNQPMQELIEINADQKYIVFNQVL